MYIIERTVKKKLAKSAADIIFGPSKHPVYISLPYKGVASERELRKVSVLPFNLRMELFSYALSFQPAQCNLMPTKTPYQD